MIRATGFHEAGAEHLPDARAASMSASCCFLTPTAVASPQDDMRKIPKLRTKCAPSMWKAFCVRAGSCAERRKKLA
ncbi:hypothetical protein BD626DRAFT_513529 [Schizophyllum amplum]|uniref:Uncharacterized protein n=1 Tax=Schizophyllum amplum TaxID=97359 RepID=A0A550BZ06_9AGAR|nr:hypothetical protein BD626DRAFT_513529 [Auriculariopsis ampla]